MSVMESIGDVNQSIRFVRLVTSFGDVLIELYRERTPKTSVKFIELCQTSRYKDTLVHRIVKNFFVQMGRYSVMEYNNIPPSTSMPTPLKPMSTVFFSQSTGESLTQPSGHDHHTGTEDMSNGTLIIKDNKGEASSGSMSTSILSPPVTPRASTVPLDTPNLLANNTTSSTTNEDEFVSETIKAKLKFSERGLVCLGNFNQILITLDPCDALNRKYPIVGKVHASSFHILRELEGTPIDINNSPTTPIILTEIQFLNGDMDSVNWGTPPSSVQSTPLAINRGNKRYLDDHLHIDDSSTLKRVKTQVLPNTITPIEPFLLKSNTILKSNPMSPSLTSAPGNIKPKWPARLVIVRHGQSEQNAALDLYQEDIDKLLGIRDADIKLTEVGEWQAQKTGEYLGTTSKFDVCFVSPYTRAMQTAQNIISKLGYQPKLYKDNWLREKDFGRLFGLTQEMIRAQHPEEYVLRNRDGKYWFRPIGGECYADVELRVHSFLEKISRNYSGKNVLIVTHQIPYKIFNALFHHLDEEGVLDLEPVYNCGIQEYLIDTSKNPEGRMKLKHFNYKVFNMNECPINLIGNRKSRDQK